MMCVFGHDWIKKQEPLYWGSGMYVVQLAMSYQDGDLLEKYYPKRMLAGNNLKCKTSDFDGICRKCHKVQMKYQEKLEEGEKLLAQAKAQESKDSRLVGTLDAHLKMRNYTK
jgi:hypothetical protein